MSVPLHRFPNGLPIGLQFLAVTRRRLAAALAAQLEDDTWKQLPLLPARPELSPLLQA